MRYLLTLAFVLLAASCFSQTAETYTICEGGGCNYTSVQGAETAQQQDLVTNNKILTFEIQNTWVSADVNWQVDGWTTNATRFLTVIAVGVARATATWDGTNAYRVVDAAGTAVNIRESYTAVDGIQINSTQSGSSTSKCIGTNLSPLDLIITNCFIKGNGGSTQKGIFISSGGSNAMIIRNNVVIDCGQIGIDITSANGGAKVDNNTIENCVIGILTQTEDVIARNNIIWGGTTPLSGNFNTTTLSEENYTDASSLSYGSCGSCGAGDQLSQSDPFVNLAGEDYHLASGATAIDAGKDLSADFTDDIDGDTRDANFDKGADEFIAVAAGGQKILIRK